MTTLRSRSRSSLREYAGRLALERAGVDVSPEFGAALYPRPREKLVVGGWQAGKSVEGAAEILIDLPLVDPNRDYRYWVIVPSYRSPHKEMDYLRAWCEEMGMVSSAHFPDGSSCRLALFGGRVVVETKTAEDPEGISAEPCDGVLVVEAGQMPEVIRVQAQGRIVTRRGWITYSGTLEDDEAKPRYGWFGRLASEWLEDRTLEHGAYSLPSWANRTVFPLGRADPEIRRQEEILGPHAFLRRFGGQPSGSQYPIYDALQNAPQMFSSYGVPPDHARWIHSMGAGGHDYGQGVGGVSPSTLAIGQVNDRDELWIQEVRVNYSADTRWIEANRREMSGAYRVPLARWGYDPMQTEAAEMQGVEVAGRAGSRRFKVGLIEARLNRRALWFNLDGHGVKEALAQMGRVHWQKKSSPDKGEFFEYHRSDDDMAAAIENVVWVVDGKARLDIPRALHVGAGARVWRREAV